MLAVVEVKMVFPTTSLFQAHITVEYKKKDPQREKKKKQAHWALLNYCTAV